MNRVIDHTQIHEQVWADLPWYVAGTLDEAATAQVRAHLSRCAECRAEHAFQQTLKHSISTAQTVDYAPQASLGKFMQQLDRVETRHARWRDVIYSLRSALGIEPAQEGTSHPPLGFSVATQAIVIAVLISVTVWALIVVGTPAEYTTLSQPVQVADKGVTLRLVFEDTLATADARRLLDQIHGRVISGPTPAGVFTVHVEPAQGRQISADGLLSWLREQPGVRFAEPVGITE